MVGEFAQRMQRRLHGDDVAVGTETANHRRGNTGYLGMPVQFVAGMDVGKMHFDDRLFEDLDGIDERDRREGIGGGIEDDGVGTLAPRLDQLHHGAFEIGLVERELRPHLVGKTPARRLGRARDRQTPQFRFRRLPSKAGTIYRPPHIKPGRAIRGFCPKKGRLSILLVAN